MKILFAVNAKEEIASTLGTAAFFLCQQGKDVRKEPIGENLAGNIMQYDADILFCGGIGMCLLSLLEAAGITVLPGCSGTPETVFQQWKDGTLPPSKNYLCSDNGRTCGACPGKY